MVPAQPTGDSRADAVLARLDELSALPLEEHVAAFEHAHEALRATLDEPDPA